MKALETFSSLRQKPSPRIESITPEMDLRGQTVDEALVSIDKYLDDAFLSGPREVTLIHGKGTGALRTEYINIYAGILMLIHFPPGQIRRR